VKENKLMFNDSTLQRLRDNLSREETELDRANTRIIEENRKYQQDLDRLNGDHRQRLAYIEKDIDGIKRKVEDVKRQIESRERELQKEADRAK
jgi:hypothetical protein